MGDADEQGDDVVDDVSREPKAEPLTTAQLEAGATRDGGEPGKGGLGLLFIAAGMALAMVLSLVAVLGYFAMRH